MHSVQEALAVVLRDAEPLGEEVVPLGKALDRVLARDVSSPIAIPPWDNASMDGYAVRAADVAAASAATPVVLAVVGTVAAGGHFSANVEPGTAVRIMTGAPIPPGADSVIRIEDTDRGIERVTILDARDAGRNVRARGEDLRDGQIALAAGTVIGPAQLGVLASVGAAALHVHRVPTVAVMSSGDELVDIDRFSEVLAGARIVSSNGYTLRAAVRQSGAAILDLGLVADDRAAISKAMRRGVECDLIITSGGVSAGAFDHTRDVVRGLGGDIRIERVRMRPGAPLGFGMIRNTPWIGLPGNPVSALVTFELFARPLIRMLRGERRLFPVPVPVVVDEDIVLAAPLTHFLRAIVALGEDGLLHARLTGSQGSGLLTSMARANALLIIPSDHEAVRRGASARALLLGGGLLADHATL
ncbi:MAG TPA: gephyrin-like molybdotransferase Glp [Gemmatimonadaceae bacterium]|nr:gephyrin-like molybdotransferase Glp [Gemmatimonadaceae bacterium]